MSLPPPIILYRTVLLEMHLTWRARREEVGMVTSSRAKRVVIVTLPPTNLSQATRQRTKPPELFSNNSSSTVLPPPPIFTIHLLHPFCHPSLLSSLSLISTCCQLFSCSDFVDRQHVRHRATLWGSFLPFFIFTITVWFLAPLCTMLSNKNIVKEQFLVSDSLHFHFCPPPLSLFWNVFKMTLVGPDLSHKILPRQVGGHFGCQF